MTENKLFNPSQHGFRSGRSCLSQLLSHFDRITRLLEDGAAVDVIYLDFAKAFDKVDIGVLLRKLKGVPQGSVLGPLFFLVLIGDIDSNIATSFISSFADDTRAGHPYLSPQDAKLLQEDLNSIYQWAKDNNMEFNSDKFEHMHYAPRPNQNSPKPIYKSDINLEIETKQVARDLGVHMSDNATFSHHISVQCDKIRPKTSTSTSMWLRPRATVAACWGGRTCGRCWPGSAAGQQ